jgi:hypothetical protein
MRSRSAGEILGEDEGLFEAQPTASTSVVIIDRDRIVCKETYSDKMC